MTGFLDRRVNEQRDTLRGKEAKMKRPNTIERVGKPDPASDVLYVFLPTHQIVALGFHTET